MAPRSDCARRHKTVSKIYTTIECSDRETHEEEALSEGIDRGINLLVLELRNALPPA